MKSQLAKLRLQNLTRETLTALLKQEIQAPETVLLQDHYNIAGSFEEHVSDVLGAFRAWRREDDNDDYCYSCLLSILPGTIVFYTDYYYETGGTKYYTVSYSASGGQIVVGSDVQRVDVEMIVTDLGIGSDEDGYSSQENTQKENSMAQIKQANEGKEGNDVVKAADSLTPQVGNAGVPDLTAGTTEADQTPTSIPDQVNAAKAATPVEYSGTEGVGTGDTASATTAPSTKEGLADEAAGLKNTATGDGYSAVNAAFNTYAGGGHAGGGAAGSSGTQKQAMPLIQSVCNDLAQQSLSYVKLQSVETDASGKKLMHIQGIATRADIVNGMGEVYPLSVWEANLPTMNEQATAGKFLGKVEHPAQEQGLVDTAIKFDKFWLQGSDVWFDATIVPTEPYGKNLQAMLEAGVAIDLSSRGYGTMKQADWRGVSRKVIQDDFSCVAFDAVWHGASTGSGVTTAKYQSTTGTTAEADGTEKVEITQAMELTQAQKDAAALRAVREVNDYRSDLLKQSAGELSELGNKTLKNALEQCKDIESLHTTYQAFLPTIKQSFPKPSAEALTQSNTYAPQFYVTKSEAEHAPKTVGELFDRMVQDLPTTFPGGDPGNSPIGSKFSNPRLICKQMLVNTANEAHGAFNGRAAARGLLALEQGNVERAGDILTQALENGSTIANGNAVNDGAPLSAPLIFPLIRRVFPQYIMNEIASIQPMDRPQGKIFYLDAYRTGASDGDTGSTSDPLGTGTAGEQRIDLNTSANPFNTSYANNSTEGSAAQIIRLRLNNITVNAYTKKLGADWSIEEMQDLRAYHGLDAAQELMGAVAREMALEWNGSVLNDMLAQATASSATFGTVAPATGFPNQKDWDEYIWTYISNLDNQIFAQRNGPLTHIVAGVDAALALGKSFRLTAPINGKDSELNELYPGTTFFGTVTSPSGGRYKIFRTNFWGTGTANGSQILGIRKGADWSDTAYVWAPYTDYVTPQLTDPADFSQKQGILSRAAQQVVVSNAMGTITVAKGTTGVIL
jgi:hypothetical protein